MPEGAPIAKVDSARELGAHVRSSRARSTTASPRPATARARRGLTFVHPFDDLDVIAGQATLGLELLEDVADLAKVSSPSAAAAWRAAWRSR